MISEKYITEQFHHILRELQSVLPLHKWAVQPKEIRLTTKKSVYGEATKEGVVLINKAFIGTDYIKKLDYTLRHEFAHLAVGLQAHHNKLFRRYEYAFGVKNTLPQSELDKIKINISFKYHVIAHLKNGKQVDIGGVHKKTKKWSEYHKSSKYTMSIEGVEVDHFEFIEN